MPPSGLLYNSGVFVDVELERVSSETVNNGQIGSDFETAINYARFGKFQYVLLGVSGIIYATCAISSTTLSFVLPSAECDFKLTSTDKGKLSAMPLIGMLFGCCIWGSLANSQGRKVAIMLSLVMDFSAAFISSFAQSFGLFLVCRFFNGFGIIGATSLIFSYLGEFLSFRHRDKILGKLEIFWNIGVIILPGLAWLFLSKKMDAIFEDAGNFSPWRIFVSVCGIPSLISTVLLYFLPETPKYLMAKKQYKKAKIVFRKIYAFNTGDSVENYPVQSLEGEENNNDILQYKEKLSTKSRLLENLSDICELFKSLTSQQYVKYLAITCFADFGLMASYYTLVTWFPEIFDRFNQYELRHPDRSAGVCTVSQSYASEHSKIFEENVCVSSIDNKVFLETLIIGLSCIPTSVSLSYFMYKLGKKVVLVFSLVLSGLSTLSLNWVASTTQTLILSCVFEALTSILEAVLFCVIVDLFPTNLGPLALTVTATFGRLGAIFGNVIFGLLLDLNCVIPIYLFGILLIASGLLCVAIPRNENYMTIH